MIKGERYNYESRERDPVLIFSLIIPTRNEAANIDPLRSRLISNIQRYSSEVIFVDDSDDDTPEQIRNRVWPMPVKVITRDKEHRQGGLSTSVLEGISQSSGQYIGVMDADLQHPPEVLPTMLEKAINNDDDIVVASRFTRGGSMEGLANPTRKLASKGTIFISKAIFPEIRKVTDPTSGFFIFNRRILEEAELNPQRFKILLELLINTKWVKLQEVPYQFERRIHGESKLNTKEAMAFYAHVFRLLRGKLRRKGVPFVSL